MAKNNWTFKEIEILINTYNNHYNNTKRVHRDTTLEFPEILLKNHTRDACMIKASRLNITGDRVWNQDDIKILREKYPIQGSNISELIKKGYSKTAIRLMANTSNIKINRNY